MSWWWSKPKPAPKPVIAATTKGCFDGFKKQDTANGCNGDVTFDGNKLTVKTHTNPKWTKPSSSSWRENRAEAYITADKAGIKTNRKYKFNFKLVKMGETSNYCIISQWWNRTHDNVISIVVQKSTKQPGKFKLRLDSKQSKVTKTLWVMYFDLGSTCIIDLELMNDTVSGFINGFNVGEHKVNFNNNVNHMELKVGAYWSNKIPYNVANQMIIEFENLDYSKL